MFLVLSVIFLVSLSPLVIYTLVNCHLENIFMFILHFCLLKANLYFYHF